MFYSKDYCNLEFFEGVIVLVVGMGNIGVEIVLDLSEVGILILLFVRGLVNIVFCDFLGCFI